jgi:2,4-dienoyl-CoA reductase-like NADH-dependent reductase (Old Yellow Enzyme family)
MGFTIRNRFIRSATMEGMALHDGSPSPELAELYRQLALGGVGFISTSACLSDRTWMPSSEGTLFLDSEDGLPAWENMVKQVHDAGAKISLQLGP